MVSPLEHSCSDEERSVRLDPSRFVEIVKEDTPWEKSVQNPKLQRGLSKI